MMVAFGAVHISSEHPQELAAFYQKILGIEPEWLSDQGGSFLMGAVRLIVLGHDQVHGKNSSPARLMCDLTADDVTADYARMVALGAQSIQEPYEFDDGSGTKLTIATLADPDGNYFQLLSAFL